MCIFVKHLNNFCMKTKHAINVVKKTVELPLDLEIAISEKQLQSLKDGKRLTFTEIVTNALKEYINKK